VSFVDDVQEHVRSVGPVGQVADLVDQDCTISVRGTSYTVPSSLACRSVALHLLAEHFEVLDSHQHLLYSRRYAPEADKGKLIIDPTHYAALAPRQPGEGHTQRLDEAFLRCFPSLTPFLRRLRPTLPPLPAAPSPRCPPTATAPARRRLATPEGPRPANPYRVPPAMRHTDRRRGHGLPLTTPAGVLLPTPWGIEPGRCSTERVSTGSESRGLAHLRS
jgi:hypothetical protein